MSEKLPELYIAIDVEADGLIPGDYSMLSFGMSVVEYFAGYKIVSFLTGVYDF